MHSDARSVVRAVVQDTSPFKGVHNFCAAYQSSDWQATAKRFAERHEIGREFVMLLAAAGGDAESGDGFIEDEEDSFGAGEFLQTSQVSLRRGNHAHVRHDPFGDDGR